MIAVVRRVYSRWWGAAAATMVLVLVFLAAFGPTLLPVDLNAVSNESLQGPAVAHPFGTDAFGRDVLRLIVAGTRNALLVGLGAAVSVSVLGITIGALSGFVGGRFDDVVMRITEFFQVLPTFIVATVFVVVLGSGTLGVIIVIALLGWPQIARVVRGEVMRIKHLEFVDTLECLGRRRMSILGRDVVPNAIPAAATLSTLVVGRAILIATSLGFLGVGDVGPDSWGGLLNNGQALIIDAWWLSVFSGLAILVTVVSFNLLGDAIGAALDEGGRA